MEIQDWVKEGAIGAAGGAAGAILAGAPIATGAAVGAVALTVGLVAMAAIEKLTGAIKFLSEAIGEEFAFFGSYIATSTAATFMISQVAGLGLGLVGSLFPVVGSLAAFIGVAIIESTVEDSSEERLA